MYNIEIFNLYKNEVHLIVKRNINENIWMDFEQIVPSIDFFNNFPDMPVCENWEKYSFDTINNTYHLLKSDGSVVGYENCSQDITFKWIWKHREKLSKYHNSLISLIHRDDFYTSMPKRFTGEQGTSLILGSPNVFYNIICNKNIKTTDKIFGMVGGFDSAYDRTHTTSNPYVNTHIMEEIPKVGNFNKSFSDICDEQAEEIWKQNKPIDVYWSGGVDSTVAVIALLKTAPNNQSIKERLFLRSKKEALEEEYPSFFDLVGNLNYEILTTYDDIFRDGHISVTGEHGDQLFGSILMFLDDSDSKYLWEHRNEPWQEVPIKYKNIELLENICSKSPQPIVTIYDIMTWLNYVTKWQSVTMRMLGYPKNLTYDMYENLFHFFSTHDFERWGMTTPSDMKCGNTKESYKMIAKQYIYEYTKDSDYRDHKLKIGSLRHLVSETVFIDDKFHNIKWSKHNINTELIPYKYGDSLQKFLKT